MGFNCFWVSGACIAEPGAYTCKGCRQYPYGQGEVAPPGGPADLGQQILGIHMGMAELLLKKEIARPEEVDEAIARNIERLANQDRMMRDTIIGVDHVLEGMVRVPEPGKLHVYVALDEEGSANRDAVTADVAKVVRGMVPPGLDIEVIVAEPRGEEEPARPAAKTGGSSKQKAASKASTARGAESAGPSRGTGKTKPGSGKAGGSKGARTRKT